MPPKAEPKKGAKAGEAEPAVDVPKVIKDLKPRWEKLSAQVGVPLENKVRAQSKARFCPALSAYAGNIAAGRLSQNVLAKDLFRRRRAISGLCPYFSAWVVRELQGPKDRQIVESNPEAVLLEVTHRRRGLHRARSAA